MNLNWNFQRGGGFKPIFGVLIFLKQFFQVQEEEMLVAELRKIEMRKKEREKKQQDLQKLITAAENQADSYRLK